MSFGYALVHPLGVQATIGRDAMRLGFDDGIDVVLAGIGVGDLGATGEACMDLIETQFTEIATQFGGLLDGPLSGLAAVGDLLDTDDVDLGDLLAKAADFICNLDPATIQGLLVGLLNNVSAHLPVLEAGQIALRVGSLADALVSSLEAPLLSGRDDMEAHRGYRAAAMLRLLLRDIFEGLQAFLGAADPLGSIRSALDEIPTVDATALENVQKAGCWVKTNIVPIFNCMGQFSFSAQGHIDVDGPSGMADFTTKQELLEFDSQPSPYEPGHWLWWLDLSSGVVCLITCIFDIQRASNPPRRVAHFIADLLLPLWIAFRTVARAVRWPFINGPPGEDQETSRRYVRFLFSDFGDFCVQFLIHFIGSISDMYAFSNWCSSIGLRIVRYFFYELQPRMPYLFLRSCWYMRRWCGLSDAERAEGVPIPRFAWLIFGPTAGLGFIVGLFFGGLRWETFSIRGSGPVGPIVTSLLAAGVSFAFMPLIATGSFRFFTPGDLKRDKWQSILVTSLFLIVLLIALLTFFQTSAGLGATDAGWKVALWVIAFVVLIGVLVVGVSFHSGASHVTEYIILLITSLVFPGTMSVIVWWFALADGSDRQDVFDGLDPATSPWLLPYPKGESWLCGQDFHGFFSHEKLDDDGTENTGNHYSYDLNNDYGEPVLAARNGIVVSVRDGLEDHNTDTPNTIDIQHTNWAPGHDPGWDQERALTYSGFLHLRRRSARVSLGHTVRQGRRIAEVDDTGVSAMNHLHFMGETGQNSVNNIINMPIVFRDQGVRRPRSFSMKSGKPVSLAFFKSDNEERSDIGAANVEIVLSTDAGHTHTVNLTPADLAPDGTIPNPLVLTTSLAGAPLHQHTLTLTPDQVENLLRRRDVTVSTSPNEGHTHAVQPVPTQPVNSSLTNTGQWSFRGTTFTLADPPPGRLLARNPGPYQLLGDQMFLRVNNAATEWYSFGAERPAFLPGIVLDRGPGLGAAVNIQRGAGVRTPSATRHVMARAGARDMTAVLQQIEAVVRALPVLVIETRRKGRIASLEIVSTPPGLTALTAGVAAGSGSVDNLSQVTRQQLRDLIVDVLGAPPAVASIAVSGAGNSRTLDSGGAPVAGFAGSSGRIREVLDRYYSPGTGALTDANPLPLTAGILRLNTAAATQLDVPISASPARLVIPDLSAVRMSGANLTAEPLTVTVRQDNQIVFFDPADTSPSTVAARICSQAEGIRAWAEGTGIVIETVAAGSSVILQLAKGAAVFPPSTAGLGAPLAAGISVADSTSVTLAEFDALVARAAAEAARPAAAVTVTIPSGVLKIEAAVAGTGILVEGPAETMAVLGVPAGGTPTSSRSGPDFVEFTGLPNALNFPAGGWLDVTVGTGAAAVTWRVDLPAEPARVEVAFDSLPAAGQSLDIRVNGTLLPVPLAAADVVSSQSVLMRVADAATAALGVGDGLTVRLGYRYGLESARHGRGDLQLLGTPSPGNPSAGLLAGPATRSGGGSYGDCAAIPQPAPTAASDGQVFRAFSAALAGGQVTIAGSGASPVTITGGADPFNLVSLTVAGGPFAMGAQSLTFNVAALSTTTTVEFNATPAHLHTTPDPGGVILVGIPAASNALAITSTSPTGTVIAATVNLTGAADLRDVADRIQRDAPQVKAWVSTNRLNIDTAGGGTGWRLRLGGVDLLRALRFDPDLINAAGEIEASGNGNVADGSAVTLDEIRDVVDSMGGLATLSPDAAFIIGLAGGVLNVDGRNSPPVLRSIPAPVVAPLGATPAGNRLSTVAEPFRMDNGWLVVEVGGVVESAGAIWGRRAWLEAPNPVPANPAADLTSLVSQTIRATVDGSAFPVLLPAAAFGTVEELISFLNRNAAGAWFGLVDRAGARHIRVESRLRGALSNISIDFVGTPPVLGFVTPTTAATIPGGGSVNNLDAVTAAEVEAAITGGRGFSAVPQQVVEVTVAGTDLRMTARSGASTALTCPTPPPGLLPVAAPGRGDILVAPYAAPLDGATHLTGLQLVENGIGPAVNRTVRALLRAEPARVGPMVLPPVRSALNGLNLNFGVGSASVTASFAGVVVDADIVDAIERAAEGRVRARVVGSPAGLMMESIAEGTSAALSINLSSSAFPTLGAPPLPLGGGSGNVVDLRSVQAAEYLAALSGGFQGRGTTPSDRTVQGQQSISNVNHVTFTSQRIGARSAVELLPFALAPGFQTRLAGGPSALGLDRNLGWGPAIRASVTIPAIGAPVNLVGDLWITLNDNGAVSDIAPRSEVKVSLNGTFDARALADRIDRALAGLGAAAAYPDGTVVVETLVAGLVGTVTLPSAANASTPAVLTALVLGAPPLTSRGWPGAGVAGGRPGFRALPGNSRKAVNLRFETIVAGVPLATAGVLLASQAVSEGQTPTSAAAALNTTLNLAGGRAGFAAVGEGDALIVEFFRMPGTVRVADLGDDSFRPDDPRQVQLWLGRDAPVDRAFELRPTARIRTFRAVLFEQLGNDDVFFDPAVFDPGSARITDIGWVRPPTDVDGVPQAVQRWVPGRWLLSARAEGARGDTFAGSERSRAFSPQAEMIVSTGSAVVNGETITFARQVRYWMNHAPNSGINVNAVGSTSVPMRVVRFGTELLVDHFGFRS